MPLFFLARAGALGLKTQSPANQITTEEEEARGRHHPLTGALHAHRIVGAVAEKTVCVLVPKKIRRLSRCEAVLEFMHLRSCAALFLGGSRGVLGRLE